MQTVLKPVSVCFVSGVHLQDITVVNEIKSDLRDGTVNWTKFSQMGRSAAIVLDCSRIAPTLPVDKLVARTIVTIPVLDEEVSRLLSTARRSGRWSECADRIFYNSVNTPFRTSINLDRVTSRLELGPACGPSPNRRSRPIHPKPPSPALIVLVPLHQSFSFYPFPHTLDDVRSSMPLGLHFQICPRSCDPLFLRKQRPQRRVIPDSFARLEGVDRRSSKLGTGQLGLIE